VFARSIVATVAATLLFAGANAALPPVAAGAAEPQLVDQTGRHFTLPSLLGTPVVITFVSAHCTDACPLVDAQFAQASDEIAHRALHARLLTITLDPQHDPPSLMRALAKRFSADPRHWLVASGRPADVDDIVRAFGVVAKAGPDGYREAHSTFVYVFDGRGTLRKTMLASSGLTADILDAVRAVQPKGRS
jgi:protein SCO1/2